MIQKTGDVIHIGDCVIARISTHVEDFAETKLFKSEQFLSKIESAIIDEISGKPENPNWVNRDGYREFFVHGYSVLSVKDKARLSEISWISNVAGYLQIQKVSKSEVNDVVRRLTGVENVA